MLPDKQNGEHDGLENSSQVFKFKTRRMDQFIKKIFQRGQKFSIVVRSLSTLKYVLAELREGLTIRTLTLIKKLENATNFFSLELIEHRVQI